MDGLHIRWMIRRDMPKVMAIEESSFEFPWDENMFVRVLRQRNIVSLVAEVDEIIVGYVVHEFHKNRLHVINFAVHPHFRRLGVGSAIVRKLVSKLSFERRNRIILEIRESNLGAHLFFRHLGFRAISVLRDFYDDTDEDAYLFQLRMVDYAAHRDALLCH